MRTAPCSSVSTFFGGLARHAREVRSVFPARRDHTFAFSQVRSHCSGLGGLTPIRHAPLLERDWPGARRSPIFLWAHDLSSSRILATTRHRPRGCFSSWFVPPRLRGHEKIRHRFLNLDPTSNIFADRLDHRPRKRILSPVLLAAAAEVAGAGLRWLCRWPGQTPGAPLLAHESSDKRRPRTRSRNRDPIRTRFCRTSSYLKNNRDGPPKKAVLGALNRRSPSEYAHRLHVLLHGER